MPLEMIARQVVVGLLVIGRQKCRDSTRSERPLGRSRVRKGHLLQRRLGQSAGGLSEILTALHREEVQHLRDHSKGDGLYSCILYV